MAKKENGFKKLANEFKTFITRGSILDMAVGVVIGGAFSAIVTAVVGILLSVATWAIPGGIKGLVVILPAFPGTFQGGVDGIGQSFNSGDLLEMAKFYATSLGMDATSDVVVQNCMNTLKGLYTLHGGTYIWNAAAIIDFGSLLNAVISFFVVALTLFIIVKVAAKVTAMREAAKAKSLEAYYQKHPEERPVPPEPGVPEPTDHEILKEMLVVLKGKNNKAE